MPKSDGRRHRISDVIHQRSEFDFAGRAWRWAALSGAVVVVCLLALAFRGLNLGIDFEGGTSWQVQVQGKSPSVGEVRDALRPLDLADAKVQVVGGDSVRVQAKELPVADRRQVTATLAEYAGASPDQVSVNTVGPTWGEQVTEQAVRALVVFFLLVAAYMSLRFEWKMAVGALVAVFHDIVVTAGVYALTGFEVTPATVVAILTILGFSLYDTVVVFDRVKENVATLGTVKGDTYTGMVNRTMNQLLMRSLNTSFTTLLPVASLLVVGSWWLGAVALRDFALALFVGLVAGTYSSIFVATPLLAVLKEREPRYAALRERAVSARARATPAPSAPEPAAVAAGPTVAPAPPPTGEIAPAPRSKLTPPPADRPARPPRPRQQRRRKRR